MDESPQSTNSHASGMELSHPVWVYSMDSEEPLTPPNSVCRSRRRGRTEVELEVQRGGMRVKQVVIGEE